MSWNKNSDRHTILVSEDVGTKVGRITGTFLPVDTEWHLNIANLSQWRHSFELRQFLNYTEDNM